MKAFSNKYSGVCHACGKPVERGQGYVEKGPGRWDTAKLSCKPCFDRQTVTCQGHELIIRPTEAIALKAEIEYRLQHTKP